VGKRKYKNKAHATWKWLREEEKPKRVVKRSEYLDHVWRKGDRSWRHWLDDEKG
jgi:hypothetical protein